MVIFFIFTSSLISAAEFPGNLGAIHTKDARFFFYGNSAADISKCLGHISTGPRTIFPARGGGGGAMDFRDRRVTLRI